MLAGLFVLLKWTFKRHGSDWNRTNFSKSDWRTQEMQLGAELVFRFWITVRPQSELNRPRRSAHPARFCSALWPRSCLKHCGVVGTPQEQMMAMLSDFGHHPATHFDKHGDMEHVWDVDKVNHVYALLPPPDLECNSNRIFWICTSGSWPASLPRWLQEFVLVTHSLQQAKDFLKWQKPSLGNVGFTWTSSSTSKSPSEPWDSSESHLSWPVFVCLQLINQEETAPPIDRRLHSSLIFVVVMATNQYWELWWGMSPPWRVWWLCHFRAWRVWS